MLTAAICTEDVDPSMARGLSRADVAGHRISCALFETDEVAFDPASLAHRHRVVVRKRAFACSFRERTIILGLPALLDAGRFAPFGSEFVADVIAVGDAVTGLAPGDRVLTNGSYEPGLPNGATPGLVTNLASQATQVVHADKLRRAPATLDDARAAGFSTCAQTAFAMARRLAIRAGERVLVTAATSSTSLFLVQRLARLGAHVCALTSAPRHADRLRALGAHEVVEIDLRREAWDTTGALRKSFHEQGAFDAVVDPFCDLYLPRVLPFLRFGGRYSSCGYVEQFAGFQGDARRFDAGDLRAAITSFIAGNVTLVGNCLGTTGDLDAALESFERGELEVPVDEVFGGDQVAAFVERSFGRDRQLGKVVFRYA